MMEIMRKMKQSRFLLLSILLLLSLMASADQNASVGQSRTLLPDGSTLALGGQDPHGVALATAVITSVKGGSKQLENGLTFARAGHSATVLPDGTVLIFGGIGSDGKPVLKSEIFDPVTRQFFTLSRMSALVRSFHTATLLTDGRLLIVGGITAGRQFADDVQLWSYRDNKVIAQHARLSIPREGHTATLLADGSVLISGGTDEFGRPVKIGEIFDPLTMSFRFAAQGDSGVEATAAAICRLHPGRWCRRYLRR